MLKSYSVCSSAQVSFPFAESMSFMVLICSSTSQRTFLSCCACFSLHGVGDRGSSEVERRKSPSSHSYVLPTSLLLCPLSLRSSLSASPCSAEAGDQEGLPDSTSQRSFQRMFPIPRASGMETRTSEALPLGSSGLWVLLLLLVHDLIFSTFSLRNTLNF
jgi:hypothetical protein